MFRGSSFHTIDPKGRIIIPTRFRDVIKASGADSIMITCMDSCLFAYTHDQWGKLEQRILHLPEKSEAMRRFQRVFIGGAHDCRCDAQGRVLIPPFLKQYSGLEKEIVLVGVLDRGRAQPRAPGGLPHRQGGLCRRLPARGGRERPDPRGDRLHLGARCPSAVQEGQGELTPVRLCRIPSGSVGRRR